jgi:hypothetical protein
MSGIFVFPLHFWGLEQEDSFPKESEDGSPVDFCPDAARRAIPTWGARKKVIAKAMTFLLSLGWIRAVTLCFGRRIGC